MPQVMTTSLLQRRHLTRYRKNDKSKSEILNSDSYVIEPDYEKILLFWSKPPAIRLKNRSINILIFLQLIS